MSEREIMLLIAARNWRAARAAAIDAPIATDAQRLWTDLANAESRLIDAVSACDEPRSLP